MTVSVMWKCENHDLSIPMESSVFPVAKLAPIVLSKRSRPLVKVQIPQILSTCGSIFGRLNFAKFTVLRKIVKLK